MYSTKLIQILSRLYADERRKLRRWIKSDFVNKNEDIIRFFEFIDSKAALTPKTVSKEKVHEYLYPNTPFNDLRIRHLIWLTTEIMEDFIVYNSLKKNATYRNRILTQYYTQHELFKYANENITDSIVALEETSSRGASYYLQRFHNASLFYQLNSKNDRSSDFKLQDVIDNLNKFFVVETIKYAGVIQSLQKISELKMQNYMQENVLALMSNPLFKNDMVVQIYYNIFLVIRDESEQAYRKLIKHLKSNNALFDMQDLRDLYLLAINFCLKKSNQNVHKYSKEAFELYLYSIEHGFIMENKEISRFTFTNTVSLGIKLKKYAAIQKFIQQYAIYLPKEYKKNTVEYNSAKLLYANGQKQKSLEMLLTNEFKDVLWDLNAKYLVLKILFETRDMPTFTIHLRAFKAYIKRKTDVGYHHTYFTNVAKSLDILKDIYKRQEKIIGFTFDENTPDIEWFNAALSSIKPT
ncbi:MAG: hypothetical protein R2739_01915 [Chitinophagales bacterium]|nr:hypothetical protein [Bacteroidota bacterium]